MIRIEITDAEVKSALARLSAKAADPAPVLRQIGEFMAETTKQRFSTSTAPGGGAWAVNSPVTIDAWIKRGRGGAKKPLVDTGKLRDSMRYQVEGNELVVGTNWRQTEIKNGAAIHQFGGSAGKGLQVTIPARPFLGISSADRSMIERTILSYLRDSTSAV